MSSRRVKTFPAAGVACARCLSRLHRMHPLRGHGLVGCEARRCGQHLYLACEGGHVRVVTITREEFEDLRRQARELLEVGEEISVAAVDDFLGIRRRAAH